MKITEIHTRVITKSLEGAPRNPLMAWRNKSILLVFIHDDTGHVGIGEAWCDGGSPTITANLIEEDLKALLVGADPRDFAHIWQQIYNTTIYSVRDGITFAALSGIDIALWDLLGKTYGVSVSQLLGGGSKRVFAYASGGLYAEGKTAQDVGKEMYGYVDQGFRGVKLKVGGATLTEDVARVAAVRDAVGPNVRIMVDAVYALSVPDAIRLAHALEQYQIYFLEAPVDARNLSGMARVARASTIPVAGNEFAYGRRQFKGILDSQAAEFIHLDAILCGGITEAIRIASLADTYGVACSYHAASSAVCFAANLHVAAATPNCDSVEYHMIHQMLFEQIPIDTFRLDKDGFMVVPDTPGLGLSFEGLGER